MPTAMGTGRGRIRDVSQAVDERDNPKHDGANREANMNGQDLADLRELRLGQWRWPVL